MKYKFTIETEQEMEIELPYFFKIKNGGLIDDSYFAILSESVGISNWGKKDISVIYCPQILIKYITYPESTCISLEEFKLHITQNCNQIINMI